MASAMQAGRIVQRPAANDHPLDVYTDEPQCKSRGGIVASTDIFDITQHLLNVCSAFAADGYRVARA